MTEADDLEELPRDELIAIIRDLQERVRRAEIARPTTLPAEQPAAPPPAPDDSGEILGLTPLRQALAEHAVRSRREVPHGLAVVAVDMTEVAGLRERVRVKLEDREGVRLTYLPFVLKCAAEALRRYPLLAARREDSGHVRLPEAFHISIPLRRDGRESVVVVVRDADTKSVVGLARDLMDLDRRAREDTLAERDLRGAVFTLTNPGALGALIQPPTIALPQSAALALGHVTPDSERRQSTVHLSLSYDLRVIDDETALLFLQEIRRSLEETRFLFT